MFRILKAIPIVAATLIIMSSPSHSAGLNDVVAAIQTPFRAETAKDRQIRDYRADFVQEAQIASLGRVQRAAGKVVVRFDGLHDDTGPKVRFRWEYEQPTVQQFISDGETVWMYLPENNQVLLTEASSLSRDRENDPMTFLTGLGNLTRDFQIEWGEPKQNEAGHYSIILQPRHTSSLLARLIMLVDREAVEAFLRQTEGKTPDRLLFPVLATTVVDLNGNRSEFAFENIQVNPGARDELFVFEIPEGVDVVHPGQDGFGF